DLFDGRVSLQAFEHHFEFELCCVLFPFACHRCSVPFLLSVLSILSGTGQCTSGPFAPLFAIVPSASGIFSPADACMLHCHPTHGDVLALACVEQPASRPTRMAWGEHSSHGQSLPATQ